MVSSPSQEALAGHLASEISLWNADFQRAAPERLFWAAEEGALHGPEGAAASLWIRSPGAIQGHTATLTLHRTHLRTLWSSKLYGLSIF